MTRVRGRGGRVGDSEQGGGDAVVNMNAINDAQVASGEEDTVESGTKKIDYRPYRCATIEDGLCKYGNKLYRISS
jgi:hypothetical protein